MNEKNSTYDLYYDEEGDFLELSFGEPAKEGTTEELDSDIFITRDTESGVIKNIGIFGFKRRVQILRQILHKLNLTFPFEITNIQKNAL